MRGGDPSFSSFPVEEPWAQRVGAAWLGALDGFTGSGPTAREEKARTHPKSRESSLFRKSGAPERIFPSS